MRLNNLLSQKKAAITKKWFALVIETYPSDTAKFLKSQKNPFANPVGMVIILDDVCDRCGACAADCPYDAIFYNEAQDRYIKCELCAGREEGPLCVELCPVEALTLGEAEPVRMEV